MRPAPLADAWDIVQAINDGALAPRFQEPLLGAVNALAARIRCASGDEEDG
jgi:hypothetical protein